MFLMHSEGLVEAFFVQEAQVAPELPMQMEAANAMNLMPVALSHLLP